MLREGESRGHYMSVGLCVALMMLEVSSEDLFGGWGGWDWANDGFFGGIVEFYYSAWDEARPVL